MSWWKTLANVTGKEVAKKLVEIKVCIKPWCSKPGELYSQGFVYTHPMTRARLEMESTGQELSSNELKPQKNWEQNKAITLYE